MLHLTGAGQSGLPWGVVSAEFDVTILDGPDLAGALPTDGNGGEEVLCFQLLPWICPSCPALG